MLSQAKTDVRRGRGPARLARLCKRVTGPTQYALLKVLWHEDGQRGAEIGARLVIDSATTTGLIDRLEALGLLERHSDTNDRRVQRLFLTRRARALQEPLDAAMDQLNEEVTRELGSQAKTLWSALRRLGASRG